MNTEPLLSQFDNNVLKSVTHDINYYINHNYQLNKKFNLQCKQLLNIQKKLSEKDELIKQLQNDLEHLVDQITNMHV